MANVAPLPVDNETAHLIILFQSQAVDRGKQKG